MQKTGLDSKDYRLILTFLSLLAPLVLFSSRHIDDNKLTSWAWVYSDSNVLLFFLPFILAVVFAVLAGSISFGYLTYRHKPLFLFLASFLAGALFWGQPESIVDASRYFTQAKYLSKYGFAYFFQEWGGNIFAWTDLPLVPFLYGLIFKIFGESRVAIQVFSTILFSSTVVLTYLTGKLLWDEETGFYGGLLLLGFPYLYTQIPLTLVDIPTMFFLTLSIYTFIRAVRKGGGKLIVLASASFFCAFCSKYSTWVLLTIHGVIAAVSLPSSPLATLKRSTLVAAGSFFLIALLLALKYDVISNQIDFLITYQKPGLKRWGESLASTFFFQIHPFITAAALFSAVRAVKKKDLLYVIAAYLVILILVVLQIKRIRYTLPVFPMIALLASYGLREIESKDIRKFFTLCIIGSSLATALFGFLPFLSRMSTSNYISAGEHLSRLSRETAGVYTEHHEKPIINLTVALPLLDYFTKSDLVYMGGDNTRPSPEEISTSPLRFTWEFSVPEFYISQEPSLQPETIVIISSAATGIKSAEAEELTNGLSLCGKYLQSTGIFRHNTFFMLYSKDCSQVP